MKFLLKKYKSQKYATLYNVSNEILGSFRKIFVTMLDDLKNDVKNNNEKIENT